MLLQLHYRHSCRGKGSSLPFCRSTGRLPDRADRCACSGRQTCARRCKPSRRYTVSASPAYSNVIQLVDWVFTSNKNGYCQGKTFVFTDRFVTYRIVAIEWFEGFDAIQWRRIAYPLNGLPVRYQPNIIHGDDSVEESFKSFFMMSCSEPSGVIVQRKWCPVEMIANCCFLIPFVYDHLTL